MKTIRLIELFAGIGSQAKALERLGYPFEHHVVCEIDKFAVKSYNAIHGTDFEPMDITKLKGRDLAITDKDKYTYLLTYSFPCQDLSNAGLQKGMSKGSGTRSGLLWEVERLLNECEEKPQILLMENVPTIINKRNKADFDNWCEVLESMGYSNYYECLNAKNFDVPQNRNRCFMVSLLEGSYKFPVGRPTEKRLKDVLEDEVPEQFYLSNDAIEHFQEHKRRNKENIEDYYLTDEQIKKRLSSEKGRQRDFSGLCQKEDEAVASKLATDYKDPKCVVKQVGTLNDDKYGKMTDVYKRVYDPEGLAVTLHTCPGGNTEQKIIETERERCQPICLNSKGGRGGIEGLQPSVQDRVYSTDGISTACTVAYQTKIRDE